MIDPYEFRLQDYSLSQDQRDLATAYCKFFEQNCPLDVVWAADRTGFDKALWDRLCATGATSMALPESAGGDGASLVDLTIVAEELGRVLAPVPWIDHVCAGRLLARLDAPGAVPGPADITGALVLSFEPRGHNRRRSRLIPNGAIADQVLVLDGSDVVALSFDEVPAKIDNLGRQPWARCTLSQAARSTVLASGPDAVAQYELAVAEWKLLTAAALVGLTEAAMTIAVEFAKTRMTLGIPIAMLQAISHPLANIAIVVQGGRNLARRAAWYADNEPGTRRDLALSAFGFLAEEAPKSTYTAMHVQGGLGLSTEAAASAYFVRSKGWSMPAGDLADTFRQIADILAASPSGAHDVAPAKTDELVHR